jgi:hypothetical protein
MTTLAANLSDSATEMRVNAADSTPAPYYQIGDEIVRLLQNSTTAQTGPVSPNRELDLTLWQIERGDAETTPSAHLSGATLEPLWPQVPGGGPGGDSVVLSATIPLTDDQIKALPSAAVEIVPAGGPNTQIFPVAVFLRLNSAGGGYTNLSSHPIRFKHGGDLSWGSRVPDYFMGDQGPAQMAYVSASTVYNAGAFTVETDVYEGGDATDNIDEPLVIYGSSGGGDFTGGDPANSMTVTALYTVIDL